MAAEVCVILKHQVAYQTNFDHVRPMPHESHRIMIGDQVAAMPNPVSAQEQGISYVVIRFINLPRMNRQSNIIVFMSKFPQGR